MKFTKDEIRKSMLLYVVTDRMWLKEGETLSDVCKEIIENGATFIQIREKDLDYNSFEKESRELKELCNKYHVPFVVNDNIEIALSVDADGVHVGQSDIKGRDIRKIIGENKILGISAGTVDEAIEAEKAGADYIGVGAIFNTSTKKDAENVSLEKLREICMAVSIPVVAIGGIDNSNIMSFKGTNVDGVAVVSAIFASDNKGQATSDLLSKAKEMVGYE